MIKRKIKVLVIDDSAVIRQLLTQIFAATDDIEVVDTALDPIFAQHKIEKHKPDVITLDIEMPRMDGLTFLRKLMKENPLPVVMISSLTQHGGELALRALELGAVDVVGKPTKDVVYSLLEMADELVVKVRAAAQSRLRLPTAPIKRAAPVFNFTPVNKIIAIGASTGGTEAIKSIMARLPRETPGTLIVQHISPLFSNAFAKSLQTVTPLEVRVAQAGDLILPGVILVTPGDRHMTVKCDGARHVVVLQDGPPVHSLNCSADLLFTSLAEVVGPKAIGVILTGMGSDGAKGLLQLKNAGAYTIAQSQASSMVFGMPKKAIELGAACAVADLENIPELILQNLKR